jgi:hypothetical protein
MQQASRLDNPLQAREFTERIHESVGRGGALRRLDPEAAGQRDVPASLSVKPSASGRGLSRMPIQESEGHRMCRLWPPPMEDPTSKKEINQRYRR